MPATAVAFSRDANRVPMVRYGFTSSRPTTLSASNATAQVPLFQVTGVVQFLCLYGIVTTALSSNVTAAYFQINDQTATPDISLASGVTLSSATAGSLISRHSTVGVAAIFTSAAAGAVKDPVAATAPDMFMPFIVVQKTGGIATNIEFVYSTTNTPASGVINFSVGWLPLSEDGNVTVL